MSDNLVCAISEARDVQCVGGKGYALGQMIRTGCMVPGGFVVSAAAFGRMNPELETQIYAHFDKLDAPFVAVRSSAVNEDGADTSWAGQLDTFLNVTRDALLSSIKQCWESAESARAQAYAAQASTTSGAIAVLVQPMIQSEVSGVAFSCHPVTQNNKQVVIEAGLGLGEAVVSGAVTPDLYEVDKQTGRIMHKEISVQTKKLVRVESGGTTWVEVDGDTPLQKVSDENITQLSSTVAELEVFFGYPVDVEWAFCTDTLYILQCRPITGLSENKIH